MRPLFSDNAPVFLSTSAENTPKYKDPLIPVSKHTKTTKRKCAKCAKNDAVWVEYCRTCARAIMRAIGAAL